MYTVYKERISINSNTVNSAGMFYETLSESKTAELKRWTQSVIYLNQFPVNYKVLEHQQSAVSNIYTNFSLEFLLCNQELVYKVLKASL